MYVDAFYDREKSNIVVVERLNKNERNIKLYPPKLTFYYEDTKGTFESVTGKKLAKFQTNNFKTFAKEKKNYEVSNQQLYEADLNPVFSCLSENYLGKQAVPLNVAFIDIETDWNKDKGFGTVEDPHQPITAVSIYQSWSETLFTLAIKPETLTTEQAEMIMGEFENSYLCADEKELLQLLIELLDNADILTGWNSESYDIPYIVNRVTRIFDKEYTKRFCLYDQYPKEKTISKFGKDEQTYEFFGRVHIDYMNLYKKNLLKQLPSFSLDYVATYELKETKVKYDGSLSQLYRQDFRTFIAYSRQDVMIIVKIDRRKKYLNLCASIAYNAGTTIQSTMGSVAWIDNAIINYAHKQGKIIPTRMHSGETADIPAAGAYVMDVHENNRTGLHQWIGVCDIKSLYPSAIRALNLSIETIAGQLRLDHTEKELMHRISTGLAKSNSDAWHNLFSTLEYDAVMRKDEQLLIKVDLTDLPEEPIELTGKDLYNFLFVDNDYILTANGTIVRKDKDGLIPKVLSEWYADREAMQAKKKEYKKLYDNETDPVKKREYEELVDFYDLRQLLQKITLNSLYGALLNSGSKFYDRRLGQSTTLSGRTICKHMNSKVNEIVTGEYNHLGDAIVYADTDSSNFSVHKFFTENKIDFEFTKENIIELYNTIASEVNDSFTVFMKNAFNTDNGNIIKASRELCGVSGLFLNKKRYGILIFDKEGERKDKDGSPGELKAMGVEIKRSDTPKKVQEFLQERLIDVLNGKDEEEFIDKTRDFRDTFKTLPPWEKGVPKSVNNLTEYTDDWKKNAKAPLPGHVRASINWNELRNMLGDNVSKKINDGDKVVVCKLKSNGLGFTSIARPIDEYNLPSWFLELPFDDADMEASILDKKILNIFGVLDWNLEKTKQSKKLGGLFNFGE